jgi:hypothetical protein
MDFYEQLKITLTKIGMSAEDQQEIMNSWVAQKAGPINMLKDHHLGTQPIRVVHNMLTYMFATTYPAFKEKLQEMVDTGKLNPEINMTFAEEGIVTEGKINSPRVSSDTRQISLHETFLSYLWCVSYTIYILYSEKVDFPRINKQVGYAKYRVSEEEIAKAKSLFDYGKSLIVYFSPWDKDELPNPEIYLAEKRNYIEQSNMCYTEAAKFILAHELTHLERHIDQLDSETPDSHYLAFEQEADKLAIEHVLKGIPTMGYIAASTGIVIGLLSMLFFSATTTDKRHPNTEDRLSAALEQMKLSDNDSAWGMACIGLELWEEQFNLQFEWLENPDSPKAQYYNLIQQIKARN